MDPLNWVSLVSDGNLVVGDIRVEGQLYRLTAVGTLNCKLGEYLECHTSE